MIQMAKAGIDNPNRFSAVVGKNINDLEVVNSGVISKLYDRRAPKEVRPGTIGCLLSHVLLWQWLLASPYEYLAIFEDDATLDVKITTTNQVPEYVHNSINQLNIRTNKGWGVFYLGSCIDDCHKYIPVSEIPNLVQTVRSFCTHAYIISRKGAETFLGNMPFVSGIDTDMIDISMRENLPNFATNPSLFWQDVVNFASDIRDSKLAQSNSQQCTKYF